MDVIVGIDNGLTVTTTVTGVPAQALTEGVIIYETVAAEVDGLVNV